MKAQTTVWIILAVVAILLIVMLNAADSSSTRNTERYVPDDFDAYSMGKHFIERRLKAPSTADFASIHKSTVTKTGPNEWMVKSYVDSQNGFGAMIRTHFTISMMVNPSTKEWHPIEIQTEP